MADKTSQVGSLLSLAAGVRLPWSNFRMAIATSLDDFLYLGRVWWSAGRSGVSLVPGQKFDAIQPGDVTDSTGANFPGIVVDVLPRGPRCPGQHLIPVNQNGRVCHDSIQILEERSQNIATGTAD